MFITIGAGTAPLGQTTLVYIIGPLTAISQWLGLFVCLFLIPFALFSYCPVAYCRLALIVVSPIVCLSPRTLCGDSDFK